MSTDRRFAVLAVAVMLVLAGCGGADNGTATPTATEAPPTEQSNTPSLSTVNYPAGLSADGFDNATLFLETHRDAMTAGPSYAVHMDVTAGQETQTLRANTDPDSERIRSQTERNGELDYDIYYADDTQYLRQVTDDGDSYGTTDATFESAAEGLNGGQFITTVVLLDLEATTISTEDDRTIITFDVVGPRSTAEGIAEAGGTVDISTDGRLTAFEYDLVSTDGQEVSVAWERTDVGATTVEEPEWLDQA